MFVTNIIPQIWSASVLRSFEKASVFGSCLSREYEGDARKGNVVKVPSIAPVSVRPYTMRTPISYDDVASSVQEIEIDQQSYFALKCEDIDRTHRVPAFLDAATAAAGYALRDTIDRYAASVLDQGAGIVDGLGTQDVPIEFSNPAASAIVLLATISQKMTENNVPLQGRWIVIPPWFHKVILIDLLNKQTPNDQIFSDGYVGKLTGFDIFVSNNTPKTGDNYSILAGVQSCGTLITQINETEGMRDPQQFGELIRGLVVFAAAVLRPTALARAIVVQETTAPDA
jgi:hypothetical protein